MGFPVLYNVFPVQFSDFILKNPGHSTREEGCSGFTHKNQFPTPNREGYQRQFATSTPMGGDIPASHPTRCSLSSFRKEFPSEKQEWPTEKPLWGTNQSLSQRAPSTKGTKVSSNKATWTREKSTPSPDNGVKCKSNLKAKEYSCQVWV